MSPILGEQIKRLSGPVMITGHTGFKGAWLTLLLQSLGIHVVGISLPGEENSLYERANLQGQIPERFLDIRDYAAVKSAFTELQPSVVIHMAAQSLVLKSYEFPRETFEINVLGTSNILEAARCTDSVASVVVTTTDKVYKNNDEGLAFVETDPLGGKDPYSASKVGTESVISAWRNLPQANGVTTYSSLRAGNVIGGGDWGENRLLPDLIKCMIVGEPIRLRNPMSTRPWQHVLDPLIGYIRALDFSLSTKSEEAFNFGPNSRSLTVFEVARIAATSWGAPIQTISDKHIPQDNLEATLLNLNSTKAHTMLGWQPIWNQTEAVELTVKWWDQVLNNGINAKEACERDIAKSLAFIEN
jgi:CDP-glucose 4,6-dehydratase